MSKPEDSRQSPGSLDIDYRETSNITHVHAAIQREKKEPLSDSVPIPLWLMGIFFLIFGWGLYYLGEFNGSYSGDVFNERAGFGSAKKRERGTQSEAAQPLQTVVEQGRESIHANCATCHQPTGLGVPGQYPPLAGSEFVNGTPRRLAMILLKGLQGPVNVKGNTFNGADADMDDTYRQENLRRAYLCPPGMGQQGRRDRSRADRPCTRGIERPLRAMDGAGYPDSAARCSFGRSAGINRARTCASEIMKPFYI